MSGHVFISHCVADDVDALDICRGIESRGVRCWIAPRDVVVGEDFARSIGDAIDKAALFVVLLSRHANRSQFVRREVEYAFRNQVPILPVRVEDVALDPSLRLFIGHIQFVDAFGREARAELDRFAAAAVQSARHRSGAAETPRGGDVGGFARLIGPGTVDFIRRWKRRFH